MSWNSTIIDLFRCLDTGEIALYITQLIFCQMLLMVLGLKRTKQGIEFLIKIIGFSLFTMYIMWFISRPLGKLWLLTLVGIMFLGLVWLMVVNFLAKDYSYYNLSTKPKWKTLIFLILYTIVFLYTFLCVILFTWEII